MRWEEGLQALFPLPFPYMAKRVYQKVIKPCEDENERQAKADVNRRLYLADLNNELKTTADKLSGDIFHYKNWYYTGGKEAFPEHPELRYVEKYYPYAKPEPLLVDEPQFEGDISDCYKKLPILKAQGFRYVIIKPGQSPSDVYGEFLGDE